MSTVKRMYRVSFVVDHRSLADVHDWAAQHRVGNFEAVPFRPMDERPIAQILDLARRATISAREIGEALVTVGRSKSSAHYTANQLVDAGLLRPAGSKGLYNVVRPKKPFPKLKKGK